MISVTYSKSMYLVTRKKFQVNVAKQFMLKLGNHQL